MNRENAVLYTQPINESHLDKVVKVLIEARNIGLNICYEFNDVMLYSADVTLDSAYIEVTGYTYEEFKKKRVEDLKKLIEECETMEDDEMGD